jgi:hypothetical protein
VKRDALRTLRFHPETADHHGLVARSPAGSQVVEVEELHRILGRAPAQGKTILPPNLQCFEPDCSFDCSSSVSAVLPYEDLSLSDALHIKPDL